MKFHVYRASAGFVLSPECMQAPLAVQQEHPPVCECGSMDVAGEYAGGMLGPIAREGFAIVPQDPGPVYELLDRMCAQRCAERA